MLRMETERTIQSKRAWFERAFKTAHKKKQKLERDKLLALFARECNSTRRTGLSLLREFEDLDYIKCHEYGLRKDDKKFEIEVLEI